MENKHSDAGINIKTPIRFSDTLPDAVDLLIIGGGVIGVFSALYARRLGLSVAIVEKGRIAGEQSSRNWGWCRQQGRDAAELPIVMEANRLWGDIDKELGGKAGFKRNGCFYLARDEKRLEKLSSWLDIAKQHQLDTKIIGPAEIEKLIDHRIGGASGDSPWAGAVYTPSDGQAEPWVAVPSVAELAQSEGVLIAENCAVRTLEVSAGKVTGVVTEKGSVRAEQVLLAAGAWSSLFLRRHGGFTPQIAVRSTVARTNALPELLNGTAIDEKLAFRRRKDGGYSISAGDAHDYYLGPDSFRVLKHYLPTLKQSMGLTNYLPAAPKGFPDAWSTKRNWSADEVSPFEQTRVLDPQPNMKLVEKASSAFGELFPGIGKPKILNAWAGMIDTMPDIVPVIDRVSEIDGLILATGMSGHGFGIGPGVGKVVADMAAGRSSAHNLHRFRYSRFSDGSDIVPGPSL